MDKNPPANAGDTRNTSLIPGWEEPLEKEMVTCPSILTWKNPMDRRAWWGIVYGVAKSWTRLSMHACTQTHLFNEKKKKTYAPNENAFMKNMYPTFIATTFKISQTRNNLKPIT